MRMTTLWVTLAFLSLPAMAQPQVAERGVAQEDTQKKTRPTADAQKQEMMKKWMEAATPGAPHQVLAPLAGTWTFTSRYWEAPDAQPEQTNGTSTMKMILGGRFLQQEMKGKAMGMPFTGISITGFNNVTGKYETVWIDSMMTGIMRSEGTYDPAKKTLNDVGESASPLAETKKVSFRTEWKIVDKNNMTFTMYGRGADGVGPEFKESEIVFKRKK